MFTWGIGLRQMLLVPKYFSRHTEQIDNLINWWVNYSNRKYFRKPEYLLASKTTIHSIVYKKLSIFPSQTFGFSQCYLVDLINSNITKIHTSFDGLVISWERKYFSAVEIFGMAQWKSVGWLVDESTSDGGFYTQHIHWLLTFVHGCINGWCAN